MNSILKKIPAMKINPKLLLILGISGMVLILISSLIPSSSKKVQTENESIDAEQYRKAVESSVCDIVTGITGDKKPTVVITLESGIRYNYADSKESDTSASTGKEIEENRKATKQSYITVRTSDGGEKPLIVTEIMPEIRGVAIVCSLGDSPPVAEKIQNAVTAALNITSQRVYVSGGISNEKG
ncbi:MAG: hypothetical protein IKN39_00540 [Clostridia bacterium]|nr:hypothetical protein [Clostridia bacterium]